MQLLFLLIALFANDDPRKSPKKKTDSIFLKCIGFCVQIVMSFSIGQRKMQNSIPSEMRSIQTAQVESYLVAMFKAGGHGLG